VFTFKSKRSYISIHLVTEPTCTRSCFDPTSRFRNPGRYPKKPGGFFLGKPT